MAHQVEGALFAYAEGEEIPWHVAAGDIRDNMVPEALCFDVLACMNKAGMNLTHEKIPVRLAADPTNPDANNARIVPDLYSVRRVEDDKIIPGVGVGKAYELLQPIEAFGFFAPFFESHAVKFSCAGVLKQGKRYFITAKVEGEALEVVPGDKVRGHLVFATSIDGSLVTHISFTAVRVVCNNTLSVMVEDVKEGLRTAEKSRTTHALRVRHTKNQLATLQAVQSVLDFQRRSFTATVDQYRKLTTVGLLGDELRRYVSIALEFPEDKLSPRASNVVDRVVELALHGKGSEFARGTAWAAYNGLTDYLSHEAGRTDETRVDSILHGEAAAKSARALDAALALVK